MGWVKEYLVSYTIITKSRPMKIKASSIDDAQDKFREVTKQGQVEEEEKNYQVNVFEIWKRY